MRANSAAARDRSAPTVRRAAVIRSCWRPSDPTTRATARFRSRRRPRWMPSLPSWFRAGACCSRLNATKLAKAKGDEELAKGHDRFFGSEDAQIEATPALIIERGEKVYLPPALVFQGTKDQWTAPELAERFAADHRQAGGSIDLLLLDGAKHTFLNEHPFEPNSVKALETMIAFIKRAWIGAPRFAVRCDPLIPSCIFQSLETTRFLGSWRERRGSNPRPLA